MKQFIDIASRLDIDCLVEVHDEQELGRALECGAEIIGINNRDLKTFDVDLTPYYERLLHNRESPWRQLAWDTPLSEQ